MSKRADRRIKGLNGSSLCALFHIFPRFILDRSEEKDIGMERKWKIIISDRKKCFPSLHNKEFSKQEIRYSKKYEIYRFKLGLFLIQPDFHSRDEILI